MCLFVRQHTLLNEAVIVMFSSSLFIQKGGRGYVGEAFGWERKEGEHTTGIISSWTVLVKGIMCRKQAR